MKHNLRQQYDIIVIGAGPAGIAFIKTLQRKAFSGKILLIERYNFPRDKVCGDGLSTLTLKLTHEIFPELHNQLPTQSFTKNFKIWFNEKQFIAGTNLGSDLLPRETFDNMLFQTLPQSKENLHIIQNANVSDITFPPNDPARVEVQHTNETITFYSDFIAGSDGANSIVRRKTGSTHNDCKIGSIRQYIQGIPSTNDGQIFIIDNDCLGYFWILPFKKN